MPVSVRILSLLCAVFFLAIFICLLRRRSLKPGYAFLWFVISIMMCAVVIFEKFFKGIANALRIEDASFLIIVGVLFFLLVYVLYLSIKLSEASDKIQELISHVAILRMGDKDSAHK